MLDYILDANYIDALSETVRDRLLSSSLSLACCAAQERQPLVLTRLAHPLGPPHSSHSCLASLLHFLLCSPAVPRRTCGESRP